MTGVCAVCGRPVVPAPGDIRAGPDGFLRCTDHVGEPLPPDKQTDLEPEEGHDYHLAVKRRIDVCLQVTVSMDVLTWATGAAEGEPVDDLDISQKATDAIQQNPNVDDAVVTDMMEVWTDRFSSAKRDPIKLLPSGQPFDPAAWRIDQLREHEGLTPVGGDRLEESLEGFA